MTASKTSAPSSGAFCASCGSPLSSGARFCHRCGAATAAGSGPGQTTGSGSPQPSNSVATILPWGVAFLALLALVAMFAGKNFGAARGSEIGGSANALPTQSLDGAAAQASAAGDISNLSPSERANRLYQRIMTYVQEGQVDSVAFFAPMAIAAHELLENPSTDERYHLGRIAEITNDATVARAQADTILQADQNDLLGLLLAARSIRMTADSSEATTFDKRLLSALDSEIATGRTDYTLHRNEIDRAVEEARRKR